MMYLDKPKNTKLKIVLMASIIMNVGLAGLSTYGLSRKSNVNNSNTTTDSGPCRLSPNITELPFNHSCLMDNANHVLIGNHIYAHLCYNSWLHQSIIDLRFLQDGEVKLGDLKNITVESLHT